MRIKKRRNNFRWNVKISVCREGGESIFIKLNILTFGSVFLTGDRLPFLFSITINTAKNNEEFYMQLVIAEKPSVAMSIAAVIGADERKDGYMEGTGYLVSWCVGHLAGLADATHYGDFMKWRYEDFPFCRNIGRLSYPRTRKNSLKP